MLRYHGCQGCEWWRTCSPRGKFFIQALKDKEGERAPRNGRKEVHLGIPNIAPFSRKSKNILNLCIFNLYVLYVLKVVAQSAYINNFNFAGWRDVSVSNHTHFSFRGLRFNF